VIENVRGVVRFNLAHAGIVLLGHYCDRDTTEQRTNDGAVSQRVAGDPIRIETGQLNSLAERFSVIPRAGRLPSGAVALQQ
jgi:hypothetical protein